MASCFRLVSSNASRTTSVLSKARNLGTRNAHSHTRRPLPYPIEGGLGKFLPPQALETMVEYQDGLLERLNHELRTDSKAEEHSSVANIALRYCEHKERTLAFNYAVLALNNSFFLDQLTPPPPEESHLTTHQSKISEDFLDRIRTEYGDLPRLKSTFSAAALGMFTNGWVWLVSDTKGHLGVLPTFGPSTLLIRSRMNMAPKSMIFREPELLRGEELSSSTLGLNRPPPGVGPSSPSSGLSRPTFASSGSLDPHGRAFSTNTLMDMLNPASILDDKPMSEDAKGVKKTLADTLMVGDTLYPLFCVPTYEHAWMSGGFGVWGKEQWLKEFWTVLDWEKVSRSYAHARSKANV